MGAELIVCFFWKRIGLAAKIRKPAKDPEKCVALTVPGQCHKAPVKAIDRNHHDMTDKNDRLDWWRRARFGMFIHWGLYSITAGMWKGERVKGLGEWLQAQEKIPVEKYARLAAEFNPQDFDADFIVSLAANAGMRYLVVTAKHHDGFAMYDSKVDAFNIVKATPFGRDIVAELAQACKKHGVVFGIYYSQDLDWNHPDGGGNDWDYDASEKDFERYFSGKCLPQVEELLTNYGPVGVMWFDMAANINADQSRRLRDLVHRLQPGCLVSGRVGHGFGDYGSLGDNQLPLGTPQGDWETPATLNDSWGYKSYDYNWRSPQDIISSLVTTAEKGVNYLLNIGPDASGRVPQPTVDILQSVAGWMRVNSGAIHNTHPNPFNMEFPWGWITAGDNELNLIFKAWPGTGFMLPGISEKPRTAKLPAADTAVTFSHQLIAGTPAVVFELPQEPPTAICPVLRLGFDRTPPVLTGRLFQQYDGRLSLPPHLAEPQIHSDGVLPAFAAAGIGGALAAAEAAEDNNEVSGGRHMGAGPSGLIENWYSTEDYLAWECAVLFAGEYDVVLQTMARKYRPWQGGHKVKFEIGGKSVTGVVTDDDRMRLPRNMHFEEAVTRLGSITIDEPGEYLAVLRAVEINPQVETGLALSGLLLIRSNQPQ